MKNAFVLDVRKKIMAFAVFVVAVRAIAKDNSVGV
jgi:hypothetical protein